MAKTEAATHNKATSRVQIFVMFFKEKEEKSQEGKHLSFPVQAKRKNNYLDEGNLKGKTGCYGHEH